MAIDTLEKRYASLTFGAAGRAGTREPTGSSSAFRRSAALGGYYQEPVVATGVATRRQTLLGTSLIRHVLKGSSPQ